MSKTVSKKNLFICLTVSLVLIIAGAFLFGFLGFGENSTAKDYTAVEVSDSGYMSFDEEFRSSLESFCNTEIGNAGYTVADVRYNESASGAGNTITFILTEGSDSLASFVDSLAVAIDANVQNAERAVVSVAYHTVENAPYYEFIWRTAIGAGVAFVLLFVYMAIRFKVGMGVTSLVAAVHDVLITLAVIALLRIPVGVTVIGVAAFSLLLSGFMNMLVFGKMRRDFRSEDRKDLPAREGIALAVKESRKSVFVTAILLAALLVVLGAIGAVIGRDMLWFMLSGLMAVVASTYSSLMLSPAIYACIKEKSDARRAEKAKYNYSSDKRKEEKASQKKEIAEEAAE